VELEGASQLGQKSLQAQIEMHEGQRSQVAEALMETQPEETIRTQEQDEAAVKLQAITRGKQAREGAQEEAAAAKETAEQDEAAMKLQAITRGKQAREVAQEKAAAKEVSTERTVLPVDPGQGLSPDEFRAKQLRRATAQRFIDETLENVSNALIAAQVKGKENCVVSHANADGDGASVIYREPHTVCGHPIILSLHVWISSETIYDAKGQQTQTYGGLRRCQLVAYDEITSQEIEPLELEPANWNITLPALPETTQAEVQHFPLPWPAAKVVNHILPQLKLHENQGSLVLQLSLGTPL